MKKMTLSATLFCISLSACSNVPFLYRANVQQGNIINQEMLDHVKLGMSTNQIRDIMGTPVFINTFNDQTFNYVYTFQSGKNPIQIKRVSMRFSNDHLVKINNPS